MGKKYRLKSSTAIIFFAIILCGESAKAQSSGGGNPPVRSSIDGNGVDLVSGEFHVADPQISIGTPDSGISNGQFWTASGWRDNFAIELFGTSTGLAVSAAGKQYTFTLINGNYKSDQGDQSTLTLDTSSGIYTFYDISGLKYVFDQNDTALYYGVTGIPVKYVVKPNGEKLTFAYFTARPPAGPISWLLSVNSTSGFQVKYNIFTNFGFKLVNNTIDYCDPSVNGCSALTQNWPSYSYSDTTANYVTTTTKTDSLGRVTTYQSKFLTTNQSSPQVIVAIKRPGSNDFNVHISYDANGRVATVQKDGQTWQYAWVLTGATLTATVTDPNNNITIATADTTNKILTSFTDGLGNTTRYAPDNLGRITNINLPDGNSYISAYDGRGNVTSTTIRSKTPASDPDIVTSAVYPATCANVLTCNKPITTTDANGNTTSYAYDASHGGLLTVTGPAVNGVSAQVRYSYTALQAYYKDGTGNIVASGVPTYKVTGISTCQTGASCSATADEVKTTVSYGSPGVANNLLPTQITVGAGDGSLVATTASTYDVAGNVSTSTDALGNVTRYRYDAGRELLGVVGPAPGGALKNRAQRISYNADGLVTLAEQGTVSSQSDADWANFNSLKQVAIAYDQANRTSQVSQLAGGATYAVSQFSYDAAGRLQCQVKRMNPDLFGALPTSACMLGSAGSYGPDRIIFRTYDQADQLTKVTSAYGVTNVQSDDVTYQYTKNGMISSVTDGENNKSSYIYDGFDRLLKTYYPVQSAGAGASSTTDYEEAAYDPASNVISRRLRDASTISYLYDAAGRVKFKDLPGTESDISYSYDNLDRLTAATNMAGDYVVLGYDALGRRVSQTTPSDTSTPNVMSTSYDLAGRRTRLTWPDGFYVTYDYLATGEVTAIRENGAGSGIGVLATYAYDDLGRRLSLVRGNGTTTSYGYNAASQLTTMSFDLGGTTYDSSTSFAYNPAGQIVSTTRSNDLYAFAASVNADTATTVNGLNQATGVGAGAVAYDARGNLSSTGSNTYTYSAENHLLSGPLATFNYDPVGRLSNLTHSAGQRYFVYDGDHMVGDGASRTIGVRTVFGPGADEPLVQYQLNGNTATRLWQVADERGTIVGNTTDTGSVNFIERFDEFGVSAAYYANRYQYTGQMYAKELGIYYYKNRFYSPRLGKFLQSDPIGYSGGVNLYNYAGGDPLNLTDPSGTTVFEEGSAPIGESKMPDIPDIIVTGNRFVPDVMRPLEFPFPSLGPPPLRQTAAGANTNIGRTAVRPRRRSFTCDDAMKEPGTVYVHGFTFTAIVGGGITGSYGWFENIDTGTTGSYWTVGGGGGVDVGGSWTAAGFYRSLADFQGAGYSVNGTLGVATGSIAWNNSGLAPVGGSSGATTPGRAISLTAAYTTLRGCRTRG